MTVRRVMGEARDAAAVGVSRLGLGLRLRVAVVGGMVVALCASLGAGGVPPWIVLFLFVTAALVTAVRPDTHVGLGALIAFGWFWLAHVDDGASPWTMLAASGLLVFHLAASAAALGPAEAEIPGHLLGDWARRAAPLLLGTVVLWLVTALLHRADLPSNVVLTAAALVVVAIGGWLALAQSGHTGSASPPEEQADRRAGP